MRRQASSLFKPKAAFTYYRKTFGPKAVSGWRTALDGAQQPRETLAR
jgi:hypothetical protein